MVADTPAGPSSETTLSVSGEDVDVVPSPMADPVSSASVDVFAPVSFRDVTLGSTGSSALADPASSVSPTAPLGIPFDGIVSTTLPEMVSCTASGLKSYGGLSALDSLD